MPAWWAARGAHTEALRRVVEYAEVPEDPTPWLSASLVVSAYLGHRGAVIYLLDLGVDVNGVPPGPSSVSALEGAATGGQSELAALLLDRGALPRIGASGHVPAAEGAAAHGDAALLRRIVASVEGGEPNRLYGPALAQASWNGHAATVAYLLELGVDPNWTPGSGMVMRTSGTTKTQGTAAAPVLGYAASQGKWEAARILLDAGADAETAHALHHAARWGNRRLVQELLERGVDLQREGSCGNALTALVSSPRGSPADLEATARFLLERGIDPDVPCRGQRPVHMAREKGYAELAEVLEASGARGGTTLGYKLETLGKKLEAFAVIVALWIGGH